jgi:DNA replicative helicase MCM subunit Mcm2 (Cdc46/Mcm family)
MSKGGRTSTTWSEGSTWRSGKTKTIRVPVALAQEILDYARELDEKGIVAGCDNAQTIVLIAIEHYISYKREHYHPNQNSKQLDINTRAWDELRKMRAMVEAGELKL